MVPRSGPTYIQDGRITRANGASQRPRGRRFSWFRFFVVIGVIAAFIFTNPANGLGDWVPGSGVTKQTSFWSSLLQPQDTNFGLFALSKTLDGVSVTALRSTYSLCKFDDEDELLNLVCGWVGA